MFSRHIRVVMTSTGRSTFEKSSRYLTALTRPDVLKVQRRVKMFRVGDQIGPHDHALRTLERARELAASSPRDPDTQKFVPNEQRRLPKLLHSEAMTTLRELVAGDPKKTATLLDMVALLSMAQCLGASTFYSVEEVLEHFNTHGFVAMGGRARELPCLRPPEAGRVAPSVAATVSDEGTGPRPDSRCPRTAFETSARGRIRTCGLRLRRPTLYPAELRARCAMRAIARGTTF